MQQPGTAGFLRRMAAIGYDCLLVFSLLFGATAAYQLVVTQLGPSVEPAEVATDAIINQIEPIASGPVFSIYLLLVIMSFFVFFWCKSGQTLGMQAWRLRIDNLEGGRITLGQALVRLLTAALSALCLGLGYLWILFDRENRSWQDICSRSQVVLLPKKNKQRE
jgi:uncharacterized RDD family membrane protein YckC